MNLKEYLEAYGIPKATFAKKAEVCISTINNILRGSDVRLSVAGKVCKASHGNVHLTDMFNYIDEPRKPLKRR